MASCIERERETGVQQQTCKMVWHFSFYYLFLSLNFKRNPGGKSLKIFLLASARRRTPSG